MNFNFILIQIVISLRAISPGPKMTNIVRFCDKTGLSSVNRTATHSRGQIKPAIFAKISFSGEHKFKSIPKKAVIRLKHFKKNADKNIYPERGIRDPSLSVKSGKTTAKLR